ncbi:MAG: DUF3078 domain-containing protein [Cytophaga sp.]|uniref:DUF3078 domain-containing protein n=1 Tax=Cytophaga sp. TaxID=29535 RepID=UPI003F7E65AE
MKKFLFSAFIFSWAFISHAQIDSVAVAADIVKTKLGKDTVWRSSIAFGINFSNVGLNNWAGGGQNAMSFVGVSVGTVEYHKNKVHWNNFLDVAYGFQRLGSKSAPFRKSDDRIYFQTKFAYEQTSKLRYAALADFRSQFAQGFNYYDNIKKDSAVKISDFLAPAYITASLGLEYLPFKSTSIIFSPVSAKYTIVNDAALSDSGAYGVARGQRIRKEYGVSMMVKYKADIVKNVTFATQLYLFDNYNNFNVDVFWDCFLYLKVNKYLTTTFTTNLIYDDDINIKRDNGTVGPAVQFKNVLAVGLVYKLNGYGVR